MTAMHRTRFTCNIEGQTAGMTDVRDYNAAVDFVDRNVAEGRGEKTAFVDPSRNLTYGELRDKAARIGPMLARMGIEPENRIALVLLDTVDFPVLFWGAIRAGIVPVLVNTRLTVDQYRYLFEDSRAKAVFVSAALLPDDSGGGDGSAEREGKSSSSAAARRRCRGWTRCWRPRTKARRRPEPAPMRSLTGSIRPARPESRRARCTCIRRR